MSVTEIRYQFKGFHTKRQRLSASVIKVFGMFNTDYPNYEENASETHEL